MGYMQSHPAPGNGVTAGQTAIAYLRVSVVGDRDKTGRLESPQVQREQIDYCAAKHGITIVGDGIYDRNRSGGNLTRPGMQQALAMIRAGEADGIIVARSDRASRKALDGLGMIDELEKLGAWIIAADGTIDTTDRIRRMATTMHFAMAESELERFREQSRETHRRAIVQKGRHMGPAPFGYMRDEEGRLVADPERADWLRLIFQRRADGAGWTAIARELNDAGVRLRSSGGRFTAQQIIRMVQRRVYVGEARHGEWIKEHAHAALVDEPLWRAASRARPAVAARPWVGRRHPESVLRGLPRCSGCRYVMKRLSGRHGDPPRWVCRTLAAAGSTHTCAAPARLTGRENLEVQEHVIAEFMRLAVAAVYDEAHQEDDVPALEREAAEADALLDELSSLELRRSLGAARWTAMVDEARAAKDAATRSVTQARMRIKPAGDTATLAAAWEDADDATRHEFLCSVVQAVMIDAGARPAVERVHVLPVWESVDLPRKGQQGFVARPWQPDPATPRSKESADQTVEIR